MSAVSSCTSCKASPKFMNSVKEPGSDRVVIFCGKCHKVAPSTPGKPVDGLEHLNSFLTAMADTVMVAGGAEVVSAAYTEGVKAGVNLALSVPWSSKEAFWMEKYGVVQKQRIEGLKKIISDLEELEKTADSSGTQNNRAQLLESYRQELASLERNAKDGISK